MINNNNVKERQENKEIDKIGKKKLQNRTW